MSPAMQFRGPARQRGAIGLVAALTLGVALVFMLLVIDSGRLYLEQRKLQRIADNAALEAVSRGGTCLAGLTAAAYASQNAARNGFVIDADSSVTARCGSLLTGADNLRTFTVDPSKFSAIQVTVVDTVATSVARGIGALFSAGPVSLTTQVNAVAVAAVPMPPLAQLTIRSTLGVVDTAKSNLLNPLLGALLGGNVTLTAAGYNGLLNTQINLLSYLDQLAIDLHVSAGNYTQLLNTTATVTQLIHAAATVIQANGPTADVTTALGNLQIAATNATPVRLGDILKLQTGTSTTGLDASVAVFDLVQAVIQLSNNKNAAAATLPVSVLGLLGVTVKVKVIEPPQLSAIGDPRLAKADPLGPDRIYVRTAQVRTLVNVNIPAITGLGAAVGNLVAPLTPVLSSLLSLNLVATLSSTLCLLGAGCDQLKTAIAPTSQIDISLDAGGATSYVTDFRCPVDDVGSKSLTARATTSVADIKLGSIDGAAAFSSSAAPTVTPLPLVDFGLQTCYQFLVLPGHCDPVRHYAAGGLAIVADSSVVKTSQDLVFSSNVTPFPIPPNLKQPPSYQTATPSSNIVGGLSSTLAGVKVTAYKPVNANPFGTIANIAAGLISGVVTLLQPVITGLLSPLLDPLLNNVLKLLGINLMAVDVGANLSCGQPGKAYLVI